VKSRFAIGYCELSGLRIGSPETRHQDTVVINQLRFRAAQWKWRPELALVLLVLWGLFIVYATMLPFDFSASRAQIVKIFARLWRRPLSGGSWDDVWSNVLLFIPWGLLLGVWRAGRGTGYVVTMILALFSGALLSGSVEIVQMFAPTRFTSFVDLVTNTFGSCVGALLGWPWAYWVWPKLSVRVRQVILWRPLAACSLAALALLLLAGLFPFRVSLRPSNMKAALEGARLNPIGFLFDGGLPAYPWKCVGELLTWMLAGGLFALAAQESNRRGGRAIGWAIAIAGSTSLAIQASHVFVPGREIDMTSVLMAILGSAAGAAAAALSPAGNPRRFIPAALLIWGLAVVVASWNPPQFAWPVPPYWRAEWIVPFWSYFDSRSLADLADVVGQALVFIPLGSLLGARSWRQTFTGAVLIGLGVGLVLEGGQAFLPRTTDISDAVSAAAGAGLGLAMWRWGERARTSSMGAARYRVGQR
jgi:VanZ family protein